MYIIQVLSVLHPSLSTVKNYQFSTIQQGTAISASSPTYSHNHAITLCSTLYGMPLRGEYLVKQGLLH